MVQRPRNIAIRPFSRADEDAVIALWHACGLVRSWNNPAHDIARKLTVQPELFLVATCDSEIAGTVMAGYDGHRGWLNYLAVLPAFQRWGIARALVDHARGELLALGCPKINLQIRSENKAAMAFYEALGFGADDVLSMGLRLIPDD